MIKNRGTHGVFRSQNLIPQHQYPRQELPQLEAMMGLKLSKLEGLCQAEDDVLLHHQLALPQWLAYGMSV